MNMMGSAFNYSSPFISELIDMPSQSHTYNSFPLNVDGLGLPVYQLFPRHSLIIPLCRLGGKERAANDVILCHVFVRRQTHKQRDNHRLRSHLIGQLYSGYSWIRVAMRIIGIISGMMAWGKVTERPALECGDHRQRH